MNIQPYLGFVIYSKQTLPDTSWLHRLPLLYIKRLFFVEKSSADALLQDTGDLLPPYKPLCCARTSIVYMVCCYAVCC